LPKKYSFTVTRGARFSAEKAPKSIWQPGCAQTTAGNYSTPPAGFRGRGALGKGLGRGREAKGMEWKWKGNEARRGEGRKEKGGRGLKGTEGREGRKGEGVHTGTYFSHFKP